VLLELLNVNNIIVVSTAALGLTSLVVVARIQAQRMNKRLQKEEKQDFVEYFPTFVVGNAELTPSSDAEKVLSGKELEVLSHLVSGKSNKEIAKSMEITTNTTKNHITHIFNKLGVCDRTSLAILAMQKGWVKPLPEKTSEPFAK
jgi:DNA-binding NarL/FixJ family response regulator